VASDYPTLPNYPRDEDICTETEFEEFVLEGDIVYGNRVELQDEKQTVFMWNVVEDRIRGKLAYNGLFGYIAIGFWNPDGAKDGMHGAPVLFGMPGGEYSAFSGLNLDAGLTIAEYTISDESSKSAFRHWMNNTYSADTAVESRSVGSAPDVQTNDCFTSMTFDTSSIAGQSFKVDDEDSLIWAVNEEDKFCGYHDARGNFTIN